MTLSLGGNCGCCSCSPCSDGKIPAYLTLRFTGLEAQKCSVDTDCDTVNEDTTVVDFSALNGTDYQFDLIYHNGTYVSSYDTGTMGEVSNRGGAEGDCISCYEYTFAEIGDIQIPYEGGCPGNHWNENDYKLENVNLRLRIYVYPNYAATTYEMQIVSVYPDDGGTTFSEFVGAPVTVYWDYSNTWFCTANGVYDTFEADGVDWRYLQLFGMFFWSETDTRKSSLEPDSDDNVWPGISPCVDVTIPMAGDGTTSWELTASATRVEGAA